MRAPNKTSIAFNNAGSGFCDMCNEIKERQSKIVASGSQRQSRDPSVSLAKLDIRQIGKDCSWFSEAHKNDIRLGRHLGTLGFLPLEIREQIWCATKDNYKQEFWQNHVQQLEGDGPRRRRSPSRMKPWVERALDCHSSYSGPYRDLRCHHTIIGLDVFDLSSYHELDEDSTEGGAMHLRYASPEAKVELENMFISTNAFRFFCPKVMDHFLSQLSAYQRSLLRSISIWLWDCPHCPPEDLQSLSSRRSYSKTTQQAWLENIERLPTTLKSVTFDLGEGAIWFPRNFVRERRHRENYLLATGLLEVLTKTMRRQAPGAEISFNRWWGLKPGEPDLLESTFNEVEPYSADFKRWSIQSWKDTMNQGAEE